MITDWIYGARPGAWGGAQWFATVFNFFLVHRVWGEFLAIKV